MFSAYIWEYVYVSIYIYVQNQFRAAIDRLFRLILLLIFTLLDIETTNLSTYQENR
jgi:hypothetical protein